MNNLPKKIVNFLNSKKILVIVITILLSTFSFYGLTFFKFNADSRVFFSEEDPLLIYQKKVDDQYSKARNIFICLEAKENDVFTQEKLLAIKELTDSLKYVDYAKNVSSLSNHLYTQSDETMMKTQEFLLDVGALNTEEKLDSIRQIALNEDNLKRLFLSTDGTITGVNINFFGENSFNETLDVENEDLQDINELDELMVFDEETDKAEVDSMVNKSEESFFSFLTLSSKNPGSGSVVINQVDGILERWAEKYPYFNIYKVGMLYTANAFFDSASTDFKVLLPIMAIVMLFLMILTTGSILGTIAIVVLLFVSVLNAIGISSFLGIEFTSISAQAPIMILTLTVADSIHFLSTTMLALNNGKSKFDAVKEGLNVNFLPITVTSLTTMLGFLTLNFSESPPYQGLGNVAALGVLFAYLFSITLLPTLVLIMPFKSSNKKPKLKEVFDNVLNALAVFVIKFNKAIVVVFALITVFFSYFAFQNIPSEEFGEYFSEKSEFRKHIDFFSDKLGGGYTLEISIPSKGVNGVYDPEYLRELDKLVNFIKEKEYVNHTVSIVPIFKKINQYLNSNDPKYYIIPESKEQSAQNMLSYESGLPVGKGLGDLITVDKSHSRVVCITTRIKSNEMVVYSKEINEWIEKNMPKHMQARVTSESYLFGILGLNQIKGMLTGGLLALLVITFTLIIALRSIKYGLISIIPNVMPILVAFGIWYFLKGTLNTGLSIVFSMTIGIVVDDTIHFLSKYLYAKRVLGKTAEESVRYSFNTVGRAIIITTFILVSGFAVLSQSLFDLNAGMAKLTLITIALALIIDLIFLPALLILIENKKKL